MSNETDNFLQLLKRLNDSGVDYTLIGGMAATAHGSSLVTKDVDVCSPFTPPNIERIVRALRGLHPKHRMRPDLAVPDDPSRLLHFKNLYVKTDLGRPKDLRAIRELEILRREGNADSPRKDDRP